MAEEQKAKYEIIYDMGTELYIAKVQLAELKEQDINARIMKNEMQDQLTANIKNRDCIVSQLLRSRLASGQPALIQDNDNLFQSSLSCTLYSVMP